MYVKLHLIIFNYVKLCEITLIISIKGALDNAPRDEDKDTTTCSEPTEVDALPHKLSQALAQQANDKLQQSR